MTWVAWVVIAALTTFCIWLYLAEAKRDLDYLIENWRDEETEE